VRRSPEQRRATEDRIQIVISRLLGGDIPPGGRCDITTLARQTGVDRTAFYGTKPYAHLRAEFEQKLAARRQGGDHPDPRDAQITRLKTENQALRQRITRSSQTHAQLTGLNNQALSRIAAQHQEITRLRGALERAAGVRRLPATTIP
jgi:hypothetical protein